ncbi:MAG: DUF6464 family protein [Cyanobacteria bacterium J06635_1]
MVITALLLIVIGLIPPILSAWVSLRAHNRVQARFELAMEAAANRRFRDFVRRRPDEQYVEGLGLIVGDLTCQLNARSPYLRCAVNPMGPCEGCRHYQGREYG